MDLSPGTLIDPPKLLAGRMSTEFFSSMGSFNISEPLLASMVPNGHRSGHAFSRLTNSRTSARYRSDSYQMSGDTNSQHAFRDPHFLVVIMIEFSIQHRAEWLTCSQGSASKTRAPAHEAFTHSVSYRSWSYVSAAERDSRSGWTIALVASAKT